MKDFKLENSDFEDFEGVNEYTFILYFDVSARNIPQSEYDDVLHRALIEEFDGFVNTFYLKDYFTSTNPSFEVKIIKNEWVGNKNHVFDYIKTTIKVEIPKYEDFTIEDVEETIKNNILYPNEMEITVKTKGKNVKILRIQEINTENDDF